jgi:flavin-binding protein dodecin
VYWRPFQVKPLLVASRRTVVDRARGAVELRLGLGLGGERLSVKDKRWEDEMADVAKVVTIIGSSPESFAKAADAAVQEAAKTLRGISGAQVVSMSAVVEGDRIAQYRTTVNIAFAIER